MSGSGANFASEPITPRGVVAFAHARTGWLWLVQFIVAGLVAVAALWFFNDRCAPAIAEAIRNLDGSGEIHSGELVWHGESPRMLAEERFLGLDIDLNHTGRLHGSSEVQVEFGRDFIRFFFNLPGCYADCYYPYNPPDEIIPVSREDLEPLWGAWLVEIQGLLVAGVAAGLLLWWNALATVFWLPVWLLGYLTNRDLGLLAAWRLAGASFLPGGLLLALGIFGYNFGVLDLVQFGLVVVAHLLLGWLYLFAGLLFLPRRGAKGGKKNPFEVKQKAES